MYLTRNISFLKLALKINLNEFELNEWFYMFELVTKIQLNYIALLLQLYKSIYSSNENPRKLLFVLNPMSNENKPQITKK